MSKPKVAICFAGLPSYIDDNKGYWQEVIDRYDADVYASLWEDEEQLVKKTDTIRNFIDSYKPIKIELEKFKDFSNNTLRYLTEDLDADFEPKSEKFVSNEIGARIDESRKLAVTSGRHIAILYKVWRANMMKDTLGREYDIVVRAETCSSYPNLELDRVDKFGSSERHSRKHISLPYWIHHYDFKGESKECLNHWVAFGSPELMNYYCSAFLYLKKYYEEVIAYPPENFLTHHLLNRPDINLRFFFSKIFRKGCLNWNGHSNGWGASQNEATPKIDEFSYYTPSCLIGAKGERHEKASVSTERRQSNNVVKWPNSLPPTSVFVDEKDHLEVNSDVSLATREDLLRMTTPNFPNQSRSIGRDDYGNVYPIYKKKV